VPHVNQDTTQSIARPTCQNAEKAHSIQSVISSLNNCSDWDPPTPVASPTIAAIRPPHFQKPSKL